MLCLTSPTINTLGRPRRSLEIRRIRVSCTSLLSWYSSTRISSKHSERLLAVSEGSPSFDST